MIPRDRARHISSMLTACAAMGLIALGGDDDGCPIGARRCASVAPQRIREDQIRSIRPAALSRDGR